jgi:hypothetical protein
MVFRDAHAPGGCQQCVWIDAEGPITQSTPQDFEAFLSEMEFGTKSHTQQEIVLNSQGGDLIAGLLLGEAIRAHKRETRANGCYSACAYSFLGGVKRSADAGQLGFHQFYRRATVSEAIMQGDLDKAMSSTQEIMGLLIFYLKEMSIDPELLFLSSSTNADTLFKPDEETMFRLRIVNQREAPLFSGWAIEPYRTGAVVTGKLSDGLLEDQQITFFCRNSLPGKVMMLASWQPTWASPNPAAEDNKSFRTMIFGSSVTVAGKVIRRANNDESIVDAHVDATDKWFLTYVLTGDEFAAGLNSGKLDIVIDGPNSLGHGGFRFSPPMAGLARASRIAFKSCL